MQITKDNLTIIIVTIKSEKVIEKCLNSIDPKVKKIIIENSSDENFTQKLKDKYQNIDCYNSGKNLGMGVGNNIGIKKSKTRYVMILNPDTILNNDTLDQIFKISKSLDFAILSPISDKDNFPNYKIKNKTNYLEKDFFEVDQVDGYSMVIDKSKFDEKFFDENIFMYLENDDLCLRIKKKGEKIFILKNAKINHLGAKAVNEKYYNELEFSRNWHWNWSNI
jgi:N-acetylglucosaminyl-diphospho-decaprenol L-rhamnosyltransferase